MDDAFEMDDGQAEDDAAVLRRLSRSRGQLRACAAHLHSKELEKLAVQLQQIKAERHKRV